MASNPGEVILVRGVGDIGSAVAHRLFTEGHAVVMHDGVTPTTTRRGMAFADALFDGRATLEGVDAVRVDTVARIGDVLAARRAVPIYARPLDGLLPALSPAVLVDARMRKRDQPERQMGMAPLTIGLGPNFTAGRTTDVVVETSWDALGDVVTHGASLSFAGEPREIGGHARDRYVYAGTKGLFRTRCRIGQTVSKGDLIAEIDAMPLFEPIVAPLDGVLRGLTHDGVPVVHGTKVVEVDPRGRHGEAFGISERPRRIASGVLSAIQHWESDRR
jgi:xanthine dehydrogenase accessory factor